MNRRAARNLPYHAVVPPGVPLKVPMKTSLKTEPRQIRLPQVLWKKLAQLATAQGKSRAELMREILYNYAKWADEKGKP